MKRVKRTVVAVAAVAVIVLAGLTFTPYAPAYLVRVDGQSMEPTLRNGDYLLAVRGKLEPGRVIVARLPDGTLVKRAHWSGGEVGHRPRFLALGDNTWNSEGRYVFLDQVLGVVVLRL